MEIEGKKFIRERQKNKTEIKRNFKIDFLTSSTIQNDTLDLRKSLNTRMFKRMNTMGKNDSPIKIISNNHYIDYINNNPKNANKILIRKFYDSMINFSLGNLKDLKKCSVNRIISPLPIKQKILKSSMRTLEIPSIQKPINFSVNKNSADEIFSNKNNKVAKYFLSETIQKNKSMTINNKNKVSLFNEQVLNFKKNSRDMIKGYLLFCEKESIKEHKFQALKFKRRMCNFGKTFERLNKPLFKSIS